MNYDEAIKLYDNLMETIKHDFGMDYLSNTVMANTVRTALETAKKEHELLDLYRLLIEFKERYNTDVRLLDKQDALDNIREITDEIYELESELK